MRISELFENQEPFRWDGRFIHAGPWRLDPAGDAIAVIPPSGTKDAVNIYDQARRKHYGRSDEIYLHQMDQHGIPKGLQPYITAYLQGKATPQQIANHLASQLAGMKKESGPASKALCNKAKKGRNIGASQLSSCVSQGFLSHRSGKTQRVGKTRKKIDGKVIKGEKHGGPLPDYS